ncbi:hypothetical protein FLL79_19355 [Vibrio cholerae]|nr:hypothetical protein FLL79_19355 [Vibrio cholerae]
MQLLCLSLVVMRCQPLRRALTLSHARVKTSPFVTVRYRSMLPSMCIAHACVGYFLEVRCTSFNFQLFVQSIARYNLLIVSISTQRT